MIKEFDKQNLKALRADIDAAFLTIRLKYGIAISIGNISYSAQKATSRVTLVAVGDSGANVNDPRAAKLAGMEADFKRVCSSFGLKPEQYGTVIKHGRDSYKLVGLNTRAPKMPILATNILDGRTYKLPESSIASLQSAEYKEMYGIVSPTALGMCSNDNAFDAQYNPIGKCTRTATTSRKDGFGRNARTQSFCNECAALMDESRAEMEAEARANR